MAMLRATALSGFAVHSYARHKGCDLFLPSSVRIAYRAVVDEHRLFCIQSTVRKRRVNSRVPIQAEHMLSELPPKTDVVSARHPVGSPQDV